MYTIDEFIFLFSNKLRKLSKIADTLISEYEYVFFMIRMQK